MDLQRRPPGLSTRKQIQRYIIWWGYARGLCRTVLSDPCRDQLYAKMLGQKEPQENIRRGRGAQTATNKCRKFLEQVTLWDCFLESYIFFATNMAASALVLQLDAIVHQINGRECTLWVTTMCDGVMRWQTEFWGENQCCRSGSGRSETNWPPGSGFLHFNQGFQKDFRNKV